MVISLYLCVVLKNPFLHFYLFLPFTLLLEDYNF